MYKAYHVFPIMDLVFINTTDTGFTLNI